MPRANKDYYDYKQTRSEGRPMTTTTTNDGKDDDGDDDGPVFR